MLVAKEDLVEIAAWTSSRESGPRLRNRNEKAQVPVVRPMHLVTPAWKTAKSRDSKRARQLAEDVTWTGCNDSRKSRRTATASLAFGRAEMLIRENEARKAADESKSGAMLQPRRSASKILCASQLRNPKLARDPTTTLSGQVSARNIATSEIRPRRGLFQIPVADPSFAHADRAVLFRSGQLGRIERAHGTKSHQAQRNANLLEPSHHHCKRYSCTV